MVGNESGILNLLSVGWVMIFAVARESQKHVASPQLIAIISSAKIGKLNQISKEAL